MRIIVVPRRAYGLSLEEPDWLSASEQSCTCPVPTADTPLPFAFLSERMVTSSRFPHESGSPEKSLTRVHVVLIESYFYLYIYKSIL